MWESIRDQYPFVATDAGYRLRDVIGDGYCLLYSALSQCPAGEIRNLMLSDDTAAKRAEVTKLLKMFKIPIE